MRISDWSSDVCSSDLPALAFGNTAVLKPSEFTPAIGVELMKILERSGAPAGVVNLVNGTGGAAAQGLLQGIDAVSFTGSVATGHKVAQAAVSRMIRVQLEKIGSAASRERGCQEV